jgi:hypothetical protein
MAELQQRWSSLRICITCICLMCNQCDICLNTDRHCLTYSFLNLNYMGIFEVVLRIRCFQIHICFMVRDHNFKIKHYILK